MTALGVMEIAELGGAQPDTVRRVICEFIRPSTPYHRRRAWHGAKLDITMADDGPIVAFASQQWNMIGGLARDMAGQRAWRTPGWRRS